MSPGEYISKKWIDWLFALVISALGTIFMVSATRKDSENQDFIEKVNNSASIEYVNKRVDERIVLHEQKEEARYQGILDILTITNERLKEIGINNNAQFESLRSDIRAINAKK